MEIKAAVVFEQSGPFRIEQLELSEPNDDEVLVRIVGVGICRSHRRRVSLATRGPASSNGWEHG